MRKKEKSFRENREESKVKTEHLSSLIHTRLSRETFPSKTQLFFIKNRQFVCGIDWAVHQWVSVRIQGWAGGSIYRNKLVSLLVLIWGSELECVSIHIRTRKKLRLKISYVRDTSTDIFSLWTHDNWGRTRAAMCRDRTTGLPEMKQRCLLILKGIFRNLGIFVDA